MIKHLLSIIMLLTSLGTFVFALLALLDKINSSWPAVICLALYAVFSLLYKRTENKK